VEVGAAQLDPRVGQKHRTTGFAQGGKPGGGEVSGTVSAGDCEVFEGCEVFRRLREESPSNPWSQGEEESASEVLLPSRRARWWAWAHQAVGVGGGAEHEGTYCTQILESPLGSGSLASS
jgi:hypothetical protein